MNDCPNAEIRDLLPDLLHDRLAMGGRDMVMAHLADCADCREELELLRGIRTVLVARAPRVEVAQILAALPKAAVRRDRPEAVAGRRVRHLDWRIAAAVTFLAVGGSSLAVLDHASRVGGGLPDTAMVASMSKPSVGVAAVVGAPPPSETAPAAASVPTPTSTAQLVSTVASQPSDVGASDASSDGASDASPDERFADLSAAQLQALLGDIGNLSAVPVTEPEPVVIQVENSDSGAGGGA